MANLTPDTDNTMAYDIAKREYDAANKLYEAVYEQYKHLDESAIIPELQYVTTRCDALGYVIDLLEPLNTGGATGEAQRKGAHAVMRRIQDYLWSVERPHSPEDIYYVVARNTVAPYLHILAVKFGWPEN